MDEFDKQGKICAENWKKFFFCGCWQCVEHEIAYDLLENQPREKWPEILSKSEIKKEHQQKWIDIFDDLGV